LYDRFDEHGERMAQVIQARVFVPGMLVQLGVFGAFFAGFSLIGEWREGVIEAERVTPASRTALLIGRHNRDLLQLLVQSVILIVLGYALGMRASPGGLVLGTALPLLIGGACAAASNALALTTKSEDVMAPVINMMMMPVLLLSGILLPMTIGPAWLERVSQFMPIRHVVDAVRSSFAGDFSASGLLWGSVWALGLFAVAVWWGTATFRRENA
jgi:ABC-2 type transport system permease protein